METLDIINNKLQKDGTLPELPISIETQSIIIICIAVVITVTILMLLGKVIRGM